jgi:bifunctional non-homologous end joining protein LigD
MPASDQAPTELAGAWNAKPMLATPGIGTNVPEGPQWRYEFKWDGVRALMSVRPDTADGSGAVTLNARSGTDITVTYPEIADLGATLLDELGTSVRLDGEIVAFDAAGRPSFEALQGRMAVNSLRRARGLASQIPVAYMIFDVLVLDDQVTMALPYDERRRLLESLPLQPPPSLRAPDVTGAQVLAIAREQGLEGIVAKLGDRPYEPGRRSPSWTKFPLKQRQDVVIAGWEEGQHGRAGQLGALLVGVHDGDGRLVYAGQVGTGFSNKALADMKQRLAELATDEPAFADLAAVPKREVRGAHWVRPTLVASVEFRNWTAEGRLRAPSYKGLRPDIAPEAVVRDT